jgi:ACT domain-containing protein
VTPGDIARQYTTGDWPGNSLDVLTRLSRAGAWLVLAMVERGRRRRGRR